MNSIFKRFSNEQSVLKENQLMNVYQQIGKDSAIIVNDELYMDYEIAKELYIYVNDIRPDLFGTIRVASPYILISTTDSVKIGELYDIFNIDVETKAITVVNSDEFIIDCKLLAETKEAEDNTISRRFYQNIIDIGGSSNDYIDLSDMLLYEQISTRIVNKLKLDEDGIVQIALEDKVLAIAINNFIDDAKDTIGKIVGLQSNIFTEVSGPTSTILLIDCEKIFLMNEVYGWSEYTWLI